MQKNTHGGRERLAGWVEILGRAPSLSASSRSILASGSAGRRWEIYLNNSAPACARLLVHCTAHYYRPLHLCSALR